MPKEAKITPADVLSQLGSLRTIVDQLPDTVATQRLALQQGLDQAADYVRKSLPKPGVYVSAGGAATIAGLAALVGAVGGGFVGHKIGAAKKPEPKQLAAGHAREDMGGGGSLSEDDIAAAAEAIARRRARHAAGPAPRRTGT